MATKVTKTDKLEKMISSLDERINELELVKLDEENILNKIADVAEIATKNLTDLMEIKQNLLFLGDLISSIGKKLDIQEGKKEDDTHSVYS